MWSADYNIDHAITRYRDGGIPRGESDKSTDFIGKWSVRMYIHNIIYLYIVRNNVYLWTRFPFAC
jgi:hypothetical protein